MAAIAVERRPRPAPRCRRAARWRPTALVSLVFAGPFAYLVVENAALLGDVVDVWAAGVAWPPAGPDADAGHRGRRHRGDRRHRPGVAGRRAPTCPAARLWRVLAPLPLVFP